MPIVFDPAKNERNIAERGLSFERVADRDWGSALIAEDDRRDYGERRFRVFGRLDGRLHIAVVTPRGDDLRDQLQTVERQRGTVLWRVRENPIRNALTRITRN